MKIRKHIIVDSFVLLFGSSTFAIADKNHNDLKKKVATFCKSHSRLQKVVILFGMTNVSFPLKSFSLQKIFLLKPSINIVKK